MDNNEYHQTEELIKQISKEGVEVKTSYIHPKKTKNKSIQISLGRKFFNSLLPDDFRLINETIDKNKLNDIIVELIEKYDTEKASKIISAIQKYAFQLSSVVPSSFNINGLIPPKKWIEKKDKFLANPPKDIEEYRKEVVNLTNELVDYVESSGMSIHNVLKGGIKGNPISDWGAILVSKGFVLDIENNVLGPIKHSINDGYDPVEFYQGAAEARRGFYYKSTAVQDPGYLSRKISMANAKTFIDDTKKDCLSKKYYVYVVTNKNYKIIQNRYHLVDGKINFIDDSKSLVGKTIKLRSPLYCKSQNGICPVCYGNLYKSLNTKKIGILASGAVNTVGVNAYMKMRHQSSQIEMVDVDFPKLIKNSKLDQALVNHALTINKNKIIAKNTIRINIDRNEYDEDKSFIDSGDKYILPGMIDLIYGDYPDVEILHLPLGFKINLIKPENVVIDGKMIFLTYYSGEVIIHQDNYLKEMDPTVISKLFEAQAKYITDPEMLVNALTQQMPTIDLVHLETIVQNMFRDADDPTKLARLNNYKNFEIQSQKKLPHIDSWLNGMAFENINKAISGGLLNQQSIQNDPYENLILEKFNQKTE